MVAVKLLRVVHALNENGIGNYDLYFVIDLAKREVDFVIVKDSNPLLFVEANHLFTRLFYQISKKLSIIRQDSLEKVSAIIINFNQVAK